MSVRPGKYTIVDLKNAYNGLAATADTLIERADVDGSGDSFPLEEFLPDTTNPSLGYQPGYYAGAPVVSAGFRFAQPDHGRIPLVRAVGQEIPLPESAAAALHLAALNTGDSNPVQCTIRYTDGSEEQIPVNISNWLEQPADNAPVILHSHYLRTPRGEDWYLQGSVYAYRLALDQTRKVKSIVLPNFPQACFFAMTLEMPD